MLVLQLVVHRLSCYRDRLKAIVQINPDRPNSRSRRDESHHERDKEGNGLEKKSCIFPCTSTRLVRSWQIIIVQHFKSVVADEWIILCLFLVVLFIGDHTDEIVVVAGGDEDVGELADI